MSGPFLYLSIRYNEEVLEVLLGLPADQLYYVPSICKRSSQVWCAEAPETRRDSDGIILE